MPAVAGKDAPSHPLIDKILAFPTHAQVRARRKEIVAGWFRDHRATTNDPLGTGAGDASRITWRRPRTRINAIWYDLLHDGQTLVVTGDLGDAIYQAGGSGFSWWARCDLDYFASKCIASEHGRGYREWDHDHAQAWLRGWLEAEGYGELADEERAENRAALVKHLEESGYSSTGYSILEALATRHDWLEFLRADGHALFGSDWWEGPAAAGDVVALRCAGHLEGLKRAMRQLATGGQGT